MLKLPQGYAIYGTSNNGNTLTAIRDDSTVSKPLLLIVDRNPATYNAKAGTFSVPTYRVRVSRGLVNAEGKPEAAKLLVDATFRTPVGSEAEHQAMFDDFVAFVNQSTFVSDGLNDHLFPEVNDDVAP